MSDHYLEAKLYVARRPLTTEWLTALLRHLWEHGVEFSGLTPDTATWEGQLQAQYPVLGRSPETLEQEIGDIVAHGDGNIAMRDKDVAIVLRLDPDLSDEARDAEDLEAVSRRAYGRVELFVDSVYTREDDFVPRGTPAVPMSGELVTPYQQVFIAFTHWLQVIAEHTHAEFGFGFDPGADFFYTREWVFLDEGDDAINAALAGRHVPDLRRWLTRERVVYVSGALATPELLTAWISTGQWWVKQAPSGSYVAVAEMNLYERGEGRVQQRLGDMALREGRIQEAQAHFQRALAIFEANGDASEASTARNDLQRIRQIVL